jgi:hypothetical protein
LHRCYVQVLQLPPKVAANIFMDAINFDILGIKLFALAGMPAEKKAAVKAKMAETAARGAEARKKNKAQYTAKFATFETFEPVEQCLDDECYTCARVSNGRDLTIRCPDNQVIVRIADALWAPTAGTAAWDPVTTAGQCSWREVPVGKQTLLANQEELSAGLTQQCAGKARCAISSANGTLGAPCQPHQDGCTGWEDGRAGRMDQATAMLSVVAVCADPDAKEAAEQNRIASRTKDECKKGCYTCLWNNKTDSEASMLACGPGQFIVGVERAFYGVLPPPEMEPRFDNYPGTCTDTEIPYSALCKAEAGAVRRAVETRCAGKTACQLSAGIVPQLINPTAEKDVVCPGKAHAFGVILRCMPKDRLDKLKMPTVHSIGMVNYEARVPFPGSHLSTTVDFRESIAQFAASTDVLRSVQLPVARLKEGRYAATVASHDEGATTLHRLMATFRVDNQTCPTPGTDMGVAFWTFRIHAAGGALWSRGGRMAVLYANAADGNEADMCEGGCELSDRSKCPTGDVCTFQVSMMSNPGYYKVVLFAASNSSSVVSESLVSITYKPPVPCVHTTEDGVALRGDHMPFFTLKPGPIPSMVCKFLARVHFELVKVQTKPLCMDPEYFEKDGNGGLEACFPKTAPAGCEQTLDSGAADAFNVAKVVKKGSAQVTPTVEFVHDGHRCKSMAGMPRGIKGSRVQIGSASALLEMMKTESGTRSVDNSTDALVFSYAMGQHGASPKVLLEDANVTAGLEQAEMEDALVEHRRGGAFAFRFDRHQKRGYVVQMNVDIVPGARRRRSRSLLEANSLLGDETIRVARGACQSLPADGPITVNDLGADIEADANITVVDDESHDAYAALIVNGVKMTTNPLRARVKDGDRVSVYVCAASSHGHKVTVEFKYGGDAAQPVMKTRLSLGTYHEPPSPPPPPPPSSPPPTSPSTPAPPPPDLTADAFTLGGDIRMDHSSSCVTVPSSGAIKVRGIGHGLTVGLYK